MPARADARFELRLPVELLERVDAAAGGRGRRAVFVRGALEAALTNGKETACQASVPVEADSPPVSESAPPRASVAAHRGDAETLPTPGCPECSENMEHAEGRWTCPACGYR